MKRSLVASLLVATLLLVSSLFFGGCRASTPAPEPAPEPETKYPITLTFSQWAPLRLPAPLHYDPLNYTFEKWIDTIEERCEGKVIIKPYWAESLLKTPDTFEGVRTGIADIGNVFSPTGPGQFQLTNLDQLNVTCPNSKVHCQVIQTMYEEGYFGNEWDDVKVLFMHGNTPADVATSKAPIVNIEDWQGQRIAVFGEYIAEVVRELGGIPVGINLTDAYTALQRGTVDGVAFEWVGQVAFKFYEVAKYRTESALTVTECQLVMNKDTWNSLPPDIQQIFEEESGMKWSMIMGEDFDNFNDSSRTYIEGYAAERGQPPMNILSPEDEAAWNAAVERAIEKVITDLESKGVNARAMINRMRELATQYSQ